MALVATSVPSGTSVIPKALGQLASAEASAKDDPLALYGYAVSRLAPGDGGLTARDDTSAGEPLLSIPLSACWSMKACKKECPAVARVLAAAAQRNPESKLLQAHSTWIVAHLLYERRQGAAAHTARRMHLASLPRKIFESFLAWSPDDVESLRGSQWHGMVLERQAKLQGDFEVLSFELGEEAVEAIGLNAEGYKWGRAVLQEFGLHFLDAVQENIEVLVPGIEHFRVDGESAPDANGARLEFPDGQDALVVLSASRDYSAGDRVALSYAALRCGNARRLLGRGQLMDGNPWDCVDITVKFPLLDGAGTLIEGLADGLELSEFRVSDRPGDSVEADVAAGLIPVEVRVAGQAKEAVVRIQLTKKNPIPDSRVMIALGVGILSDDDTFKRIVEEEKEEADVLGDGACERRGLRLLQTQLKAMSKGLSDAVVGGEVGSRQHKAGLVIAAEREIAEVALAEIATRLESRAATTPTPVIEEICALGAQQGIEAYLADSSDEPTPGSHLGRALAQLRGCNQGLERVGSEFFNLRSKGHLTAREGRAALRELDTLSACVSSGTLGDASQLGTPLLGTSDVIVRSLGEATNALLAARLAASEWQAACHEKSMEDDENQAPAFARALVQSAKIRATRMDLEMALADLRRSLEVQPGLKKTLDAARDVAGALTARSQNVFATVGGGNAVASAAQGKSSLWKDCGPTFEALREQLQKLGFTRVVSKLPLLRREPLKFSEMLRSEAVNSAMRAVVDEIVMAKVGDADPEKNAKVKKWTGEMLLDLIHLFLAHQAVPLSRAKLVLGKEACMMLLERSALSCFDEQECRVLEPMEAVGIAAKPKVRGHFEPMVFSNFALWLVDEDLLLASDFDQSTYSEGTYEPVAHHSHDSAALAAGAPRSRRAARVLDLCCGGGAQGLVALKHYADRATFADASARSLRFADFSARLNGFEGKADFVEADVCDQSLPKALSEPFDVVLACLPYLPNPDRVVTASGSAFALGGPDGERVLSAAVAKSARRLLKPGGWMVAAATVPNAELLPSRVEGWISSESGKNQAFRAVVFRDEAKATKEYELNSSHNCGGLQVARYSMGLESAGIGSLSPALLLVLVPPGAGGAAAEGESVELQPEHKGLWSDTAYLAEAMPWALDHLVELLSFSRLVDQGPTAKGDNVKVFYSLEWDEDEEEDGAPKKPVPTPAQSQITKIWPKPADVSHKVGMSYEDHEADGATWNDVMNLSVLGFAPPILCGNHWYKTLPPKQPGSLYAKKAPGGKKGKKEVVGAISPVCLVELKGCGVSVEVQTALRNIAGITHLFTWEGEPRKLKHQMTPTNTTDATYQMFHTLVIPIDASAFKGESIAACPTEILKLFQFISDDARMQNRSVRLVFLTCGATGPTYPGASNDRMNPASPIRGMMRCLRMEVPQVPVMVVDCDAFGLRGKAAASECIQQLHAELSLHSPENTLNESNERQGLAVILNNREVAYREGVRFVPKLDVSCRNPIFGARSNPQLPPDVCDGVCIITGGTGGLGVVTAEACVEMGAKCVVLTSRSGKVVRDTQGLEDRLDRLRETGAKILVEKCDSSDEKQVKDLLKSLRRDHGPIRNIVHAAGILVDRLMDMMSADDMAKSFGPKADGAWFMHKHTLQDKIEAFVTFSSTTALMGNAGQMNYGGSNMYLDELMTYRTTQGLAGTSVHWPAVTEVGMAAATIIGENFDHSYSVGPACVKSVMKQLIGGRDSIAPVQSVLPIGFLQPQTPFVHALLEPIHSKIDKPTMKKWQDEEANRAALAA